MTVFLCLVPNFQLKDPAGWQDPKMKARLMVGHEVSTLVSDYIRMALQMHENHSPEASQCPWQEAGCLNCRQPSLTDGKETAGAQSTSSFSVVSFMCTSVCTCAHSHECVKSEDNLGYLSLPSTWTKDLFGCCILYMNWPASF